MTLRTLRLRAREVVGNAFILILAVPFICMDAISHWPDGPVTRVLRWLIARMLLVAGLLACALVVALLAAIARH